MSKNKRWTKEEIEILKENYGILSSDELAELLPDRGKTAILNKASTLNLGTNYIAWSEEEINKLIELFPTHTLLELCERLPNRTMNSISKKAKSLNLTKTEEHMKNIKERVRQGNKKWEENEDEIIRKYYPIGGYKAVLEHLPDKNSKTIAARAKKLGVKRMGKFNYKWERNIVSIDDHEGSREVTVKFMKTKTWE